MATITATLVTDLVSGKKQSIKTVLPSTDKKTVEAYKEALYSKIAKTLNQREGITVANQMPNEIGEIWDLDEKYARINKMMDTIEYQISE